MTGLELVGNGSSDTTTVRIPPPWTVWKKKAKEGKEAWFKDNISTLQKLSENRIQNQINNLLWYTGEYDKTLEYRMVVPNHGEQAIPRRILPRIFNHLFDITEQRVSRLSRFKPSFDVAPTNLGQDSDRQNALLIKTCIQAVARRVKMDFMMQAIERWTAVFGEVLIGVEWNENIGDRKGRKTIERVGDVDIYIKEPWTYFPEPKAQWDKVTYCVDIWDIVHFEEARVIFDDKTIVADGKKNVFSFNDGICEKRDDEVVIYRLIQRPTQFLPEGNISFFVNDKLVNEVTEYPYSHMDFPYERHTDIDVPGRLFPISCYQQLLPVQHVYNRLTSIMVRNLLYVGHPHILNPIGSGAKRESFGNGPSEIKYNPIGGFRPEILTFNSVPQDFFTFRDGVKGELNQISGIQGVSRGAPPAGVRAASMLRFYAEQEEQRASTQIIKHNEIIRRIFQKTASVIGDYYPLSPDRLIRVLGPQNKYMTEAFGQSKISSEYDVIIVNSTGFSEDMSGRLEEITLITQLEKDGGKQLLTPEEKADVLQLRNPQRAYDIATSALRSAQINIDLFRRGKKVPTPERYWNLIVHWRETMIFVNSPEWPSISKSGREGAIAHISMLERLMEKKGMQSQSFMTLVDSLEGYPAVWNPTESTDNGETAPQAPPGGELGIPGQPGAPGGLPGLPGGMQPAMPQGGLPLGMSATGPAGLQTSPPPMFPPPSPIGLEDLQAATAGISEIKNELAQVQLGVERSLNSIQSQLGVQDVKIEGLRNQPEGEKQPIVVNVTIPPKGGTKVATIKRDPITGTMQGTIEEVPNG